MKEMMLALLAALGFGGIVGAYFQSLFQRQTQLKEKEHELKSRRYKTILILMLTKLDPENGLQKIAEFRDDLKTVSDVERELETELLNSVLFANDAVIRTLAEFSRSPAKENYIRAAVAMRKDLWNKQTRIKEDWLAGLRLGETSHNQQSEGIRR